MIISGQPGVGKSTFINKILGEKRCKEGRGRPVTSKIVKYMHPLFPIAIYDTPGFESEKDVDKVIDLIKKQQNALLEGKDQIHLILFLINQETSRTLLPNDPIPAPFFPTLITIHPGLLKYSFFISSSNF